MEELRQRKIRKISQAWDLGRFPHSPRADLWPLRMNALSAQTSDALDKVKFRFKSFPKFYSLARDIVSPVCPDSTIERRIRANNLKELFFINVGSGNTLIDPELVNSDFIDYPNVDLVTDAGALPFRDETVDGIVCLSVLEHVPNPQEVVADFFRILKKGACVYCVIPFMQGYHASPHDYSRFTISGMRELFKDFEIVSLEPEGGPTSALLWIFQEWLATLLSFGSRRLQRLWLLTFMATLWPIKFLDIFLKHYPTTSNISSLFRIVARKR